MTNVLWRDIVKCYGLFISKAVIHTKRADSSIQALYSKAYHIPHLDYALIRTHFHNVTLSIVEITNIFEIFKTDRYFKRKTSRDFKCIKVNNYALELKYQDLSHLKYKFNL